MTEHVLSGWVLERYGEDSMENSKLSNKFSKDKLDNALKFVKEHTRYFAAGVLLLVLILVLVNCTEPKMRQGGDGVDGTEGTIEEPYQVDAYENVNALIGQYYTAYAAGDVATLATLATPISTNEQSYITLFSQYVDEYQNIKCYTKSGLDANSYLVSVSMEIKFTGVDTTAPGLDFFYVRTNDDGALYIDNLYSQYNLANQENALDTSVQSLIYEFENNSDVMELQNEIQTRYDNALAADSNLSVMIQTTIPGAISEWVAQVKQSTEVADQTTGVTDETTDQNEMTEETPAETTEDTTQQTETLATTDRVNIRKAADASSDKLATVDAGTVVTRTGVDGDWSIIDYNGETGYIKNEFLTYDLPSATDNNETEESGVESEETTVVNISEGTEIILQDTVNIRSGMSETADRIGTAYRGEKVTVVMSYAEGWTKVKWNGETGYIKSSLLQ